MQVMRSRYWLVALSALIGSLAFGQNNDHILCDEVNAKGELKINQEEISEIDQLCECAEIASLKFKKVIVLRLPDCLTQLERLHALSFSKTKIEAIPETVFAIETLEKLDLSYTQIHHIPKNIAELKGLKMLDLRGTFVESLPPGLGHLERIDMRFIEMNRATQKEMHSQYPNIDIYFSSPCNCK